MRGLRIFLMGVVAGLTYAAVSQELQKPPAERTWSGSIGMVPYNFRVDEWRELAKEYWNPASEQIIGPKAIGVGWSVNFAALAHKAQGWLQSSSAPAVAEKAGE